MLMCIKTCIYILHERIGTCIAHSQIREKNTRALTSPSCKSQEKSSVGDKRQDSKLQVLFDNSYVLPASELEESQ